MCETRGYQQNIQEKSSKVVPVTTAKTLLITSLWHSFSFYSNAFLIKCLFVCLFVCLSFWLFVCLSLGCILYLKLFHAFFINLGLGQTSSRSAIQLLKQIRSGQEKSNAGRPLSCLETLMLLIS